MKRFFKFLFLKLPLALILLSVLLVLALKWVPVWVTPIMVSRSIEFRSDPDRLFISDEQPHDLRGKAFIEHKAYDAGYDCGNVVRQIAERTIVYAGHYVIQGDSLVYQMNK